MSRGIDYSKWDHLEDDDSDEEITRRAPQVTKLARPTQVTWQPDGSIVASPMNEDISISSSDDRKVMPTADARSDTTNESLRSIAFVPSSTNTPETQPASSTNTSRNLADDWTRHGGVVNLPESMGIVANGSKLYWSQDRNSVTVRWQMPPASAIFGGPLSTSTNQKVTLHVQLTGGVSYRERNRAVMTSLQNSNNNNNNHPTLLVYHSINKKHELLWRADLPYPIHYDEDDDDEDDDMVDDAEGDSSNNTKKHEKHHYVDWSMEGGTKEEPNAKYLRVTWQKAVPMEGMILWWKRPLLNVPEENIVLPGRSETQQSQSSFQDNWNQAHEQFKAKIAQQKLQQQQQGLEQEGQEEHGDSSS